jgi:Ca-activated chloride channel family protein
MTFHDPWAFLCLPLLPLVVAFSRLRGGDPYFRFSTGEFASGLRTTLKQKLAHNLVWLRFLALALFVSALARPQLVIEESKTTTEGVDIVLVLDTSTSMLGEDFKTGGRRINRFDVVRDVVKDFVDGRKDDRMGLVAFAGRPYTVSPLTLDHKWLEENLDRVRVGMIEDATAIGSALATAVNRLKNSKSKSKIVVLLTDGINNAGKITPLTAAEAAKALKVKVYTIGIGTKGLVPYPMKDYFGNTVYQNIRIDIDDETLEKIASITGGKYYRATDTEMLKRIYAEINKLEKTKIEHVGYREYKELFEDFLIPGLALLLVEIFLSQTILVRLP